MRALIGSGLFVGGTSSALWYGVSAVRAWLRYRAWVERDPSGAELYLLNSRLAAVVALLGVGLAYAGWRLVRRPAPHRAPTTAA